MPTVSVRYIVNDVDEAIAFYGQHLGFREDMHPAPTFAMMSRGDLRLVLSAPGGGPGGGQAMPDGTLPSPGGWNRFSIEVSDLEGLVERLRQGAGRLNHRDPDPLVVLLALFQPVPRVPDELVGVLQGRLQVAAHLVDK